MSAQFDFNPGIDISGLSSVTQAQLLQMVAQLAPLDNIGGVIVMSGAASAHPDITNNPRFVRYIWLDTQTAGAVLLKIYQGTYPSDTYADWSTVNIADGSITAAKLANYAVSILNGSGASKIAYKQDGTADATKSNYLVRLDAAGQYVEVVSAASVVNGVTINLSQINVSAATNGYVLSYDSSLGAAVWTALSVSSLISANSVSYDKLLNGSAGQAGYLMRANSVAPYDIQLVQNNDQVATLFPVRSIPLNKLYAAAYTAGQGIYTDGTNFVIHTPYYSNNVGSLPAASGLIVSISAATHGFGTTVPPRVIRPFLVCTAADAGYAINDVVGIESLSSNSTTYRSCFSTSWRATTGDVRLATYFSTDYYIVDPAGAYGALDRTKWTVGVYIGMI